MSRWILALLLVGFLVAAASSAATTSAPAQLKRERAAAGHLRQGGGPAGRRQFALAVTEYSFNPLQSKKERADRQRLLQEGQLPRRRHARFRDATKWNDGNSEAWLQLGEAEEKLKDPKAAKEAYTKYLALAADAKNAAEIRKKLQKLK